LFEQSLDAALKAAAGELHTNTIDGGRVSSMLASILLDRPSLMCLCPSFVCRDGGFSATEDQQRQNYAATIKRKLVERKANPRGFEWIDARGKVLKRTFSGVPFPVLGKNDEVLTIQRYHAQPDLGAVLGVELKKKLTCR
jgi:hypothetical protein